MIGHWKQKNVLESLESTEKFMVAVIDAALAAQNASIAAESISAILAEFVTIYRRFREF